jgi:acyl-CoA synthetase (AMP-forming)/AMP-acid ligase II
MHGKLRASWSGLARWLGFTSDDVHLVQLPLSHGFGLMLATAGLLAGGRLVCLDGFSAESGLEAIERQRVTVLNGTPAHFGLLVDRLGGTARDVSSLRIGVAAGAAFHQPLLESIYGVLGMELLLMYGSSEGVGVATRERDEILAGSVGRPDPPGSVAIMDAGGRPLPAGEVGEIAFARSSNPVRYWGEQADGAQPEGAQPPTAGWYHSGDLGRLDQAGRLHVVGRIKHQINRGGLKIDPVEVEAALLACTGVADGAVVGVPNPFLEEVVCACVVPAAGADPALQELRAELSGRLASFKLPEELCTLERIPRTALGKVDHELLRGLALVSGRQSTRRPAPVA